jgi:hypothetical protein
MNHHSRLTGRAVGRILRLPDMTVVLEPISNMCMSVNKPWFPFMCRRRDPADESPGLNRLSYPK